MLCGIYCAGIITNSSNNIAAKQTILFMTGAIRFSAWFFRPLGKAATLNDKIIELEHGW